MQFSFSNQSAVPQWLWEKERETVEARSDRKGQPLTGTQFIAPTEQVMVSVFTDGLYELGFRLVDAFYQKRPNVKKGGFYHMVRFVFSRDPSRVAEIKEQYETLLRKSLVEIDSSAFWRVRAYKNESRTEEGKFHISVNLEARTPLYRPNGDPVLARRKDEFGEAYGEPVPLLPNGALRVVNGTIVVS